MASFHRLSLILMTSCAGLALAACDGANDIASPGTGGNVIINNPAPTPAPSPTPTPVATLVTPATGCPTIADPQGLTDAGTITGPTGTWRVCTLPARINSSVNLPKVAGLLYRLGGRVDVGTDLGAAAVAGERSVTLSIEPGVIVFGGTGVSWLAVNRGNKINAVGTATAPVIFTSRDNILGLNTDSSSGQWGGVVLMGRAQITDCAAPGATPGTVGCERQTEGAVDPALYGGATNTDNSGRMSFVQIRYSGYVLSADAEPQSLTTEGVGSGTQLDHIMSFNSSDDGAELFGGNVNMKYFVSVGAEDDNLDSDTGVKANIQYVIAAQRSGIGDAMIEADTDNAFDAQTPRQNTRVSNATFIQRSTTGADLAAILLRGGTDYTLVNSVVVSPDLPCLRISRANTIQAANAATDEAGPPVFRSVVMQCAATKYIGSNTVTATDVQTVFGSGANGNNDAFTNTLTGGFINGANESAVAAFNASTLGAFFDATTFIGAARSTDTWFQGWTCNSATLTFGTGNSGNCTSIPTT
jgi:hypothetical protein